MMDLSFNHLDVHRVILETEDLLFPVATDQIYLVMLLENDTIQLSGVEKSFILSGFCEINIDKLLNVGFIRIHPKYLINPHFIRQIRIKEKEIEFLNGEKLPISKEYQKSLMNYFKESTMIPYKRSLTSIKSNKL